MKSAKRRMIIAKKAYGQGIRLKNCNELERAYIMMSANDGTKYAGRDLALYADRVFVFDGCKLITMLPCDNHFKRMMENSRFAMHNDIACGHVDCYCQLEYNGKDLLCVGNRYRKTT